MNDKIINVMTDYVSKLTLDQFDDIDFTDVNQLADDMMMCIIVLDDIDHEAVIENDYYFDMFVTLLRNRYIDVIQ